MVGNKFGDYIEVIGARQHNLKNISVKIPKNKLVVVTGISGSGKSSLAFDTIYAEGQRRYVESLSSYARQFLGVMDKPDVDRITGLSPAIAIDQKAASSNPRSTVATITEIYDYLRLLFARVGHPHCPNCGREVRRQTTDQIADNIFEEIKTSLVGKRPTVVEILAPVVRDRKGEFSQLFSALRKDGYQKVVVDGKDFDLDEDFLLIKTNKHSISVVVDRISFRRDDESPSAEFISRLTEAVERAAELTDGLVLERIRSSERSDPFKLWSMKFACPECNISLPEIEPRMFSFNSPHGACQRCSGLGTVLSADPEAEIDIPNLLQRYLTTDNEAVRRRLARFIISDTCPECRGARLRPEALSVTVAGKNIAEVTGMTCTAAKEFVTLLYGRGPVVLNPAPTSSPSVDFSARAAVARAGSPRTPPLLSNSEFSIATPILRELSTRLEFLINVGLDYLTLDRKAGTLAGGEIQRIRLASQIGTGLTGILYVLDEPTIGLHQRDNSRLLSTLYRLRDLGNTVIVVEHDRETIEAADWVIDIGPGAGKKGGGVVAEGTPEEIKKNKKSLTGEYLSGRKSVAIGRTVKQYNGETVISESVTGRPVNRHTDYRYTVSPFHRNTDESIKLYGASQNNLKHIDVEFPLGKFICVTGISGSGKSTLIHDTLYHALARQIYRVHHDIPGKYDQMYVPTVVQKVGLIDQSPIGRTPRSNPATYSGAFTPIRELFSQTKEARLRGYKPGRFSFNVSGGRCEACEGQGQTKVEMQFLADIYVKCEVCGGTRYSRETLEVDYHGKTIYDVLKMPVSEALAFLGKIPLIRQKLSILERVGLGYLELGQPAPLLSGGEAQRLKLSRELGKVRSGHTVYLLDEPTTGLHFADLQKLLDVLHELVSHDNTVIVIEHNLDLVKNVDWIIDLGPEGGERGGEVVAVGNPMNVAMVEKSYTGRYLKKMLNS